MRFSLGVVKEAIVEFNDPQNIRSIVVGGQQFIEKNKQQGPYSYAQSRIHGFVACEMKSLCDGYAVVLTYEETDDITGCLKPYISYLNVETIQ